MHDKLNGHLLERMATVKGTGGTRCTSAMARRVPVSLRVLGVRIHRYPAPGRKKTTQDTISCQFLDTLTHDGSRYSVGLLWKPGVVRLPDNYAFAEQRSLRKDLAKQREYTAVIEEYLRKGWAEEVTTQCGQPGKTRYLPHHAVYKIADGKTKCREVFDRSAKYADGSKPQADLVSILLRLGQYRIAAQADVEKMYLQVGLRAEDRDACRFLWRTAYQMLPREGSDLPECASGWRAHLTLQLRSLRGTQN
ncbi:hypothetical protein T10_9587 [Trichinella papuae]|uniref:Uncharacterized protein n=1 Tax=Trichinella papuae TaxID=268474 RepID=A0A0V1M1E7_9BILA|nr:hypothetical protein T10_3762 [Trichinella papuae]KRZ75228.1 hypothetical protein T10_9587 [Trichinella papuae]